MCGMYYGSGDPEFVKHSARFWLVKEEFDTGKVTPPEEDDDAEDSAKLIGTALLKKFSGKKMRNRCSKNPRRRSKKRCGKILRRSKKRCGKIPRRRSKKRCGTIPRRSKKMCGKILRRRSKKRRYGKIKNEHSDDVTVKTDEFSPPRSTETHDEFPEQQLENERDYPRCTHSNRLHLHSGFALDIQ